MLAELLVAALARGVEDAAFGRPLDPRPKPQLQDTRLPHMIPHSTDQRTTFCAMQVGLWRPPATHLAVV